VDDRITGVAYSSYVFLQWWKHDMDALILENIRCFTEPPPIPIRPITLLVGENSTGKTTVLASIRLVADLIRQLQTPDFNEEPFQLGSYNDIANYRGSRWRAPSFSLGFEVSQNGRRPIKRHTPVHKKPIRFLTIFTRYSAQPILSEWKIYSGGYSICTHIDTEGHIDSLEVHSPSNSIRLHGKVLRDLFPSASNPRHLFRFFIIFPDILTIEDIQFEGTLPSQEDTKYIQHLIDQVVFSFRSPPYAVAPIRTKPKRTYDPISEQPTPEGDHIPMVLARTSNANPEDWDRLSKQLAEFGKTSGLFNTITVKNLSRAESGPFQIRLSFGGPKFNLVDIGYGVSQGLPVVVDALRAKKGQTVLIQQPEVHLHPRAQAALGSLLAGLAMTDKKTFIIETHSDHLIDRIRMDVRDGVGGLKPEHVSIIYFERTSGSEVQIYPMTVDKLGNLLDAPRGYRRFFLDEERRFLKVSK